jgi:hypothetical protein
LELFSSVAGLSGSADDEPPAGVSAADRAIKIRLGLVGDNVFDAVLAESRERPLATVTIAFYSTDTG